ncbi:MAG TPA: phosphosulfolactate synthase, partial [Methylococcaceae bacterium]|nr:phosphosulfolactate synthase [Methylococcaceae bacterium]
RSGAAWVIIEGRESGQGVGIFDEAGKVEEFYLDQIIEIMGSRISELIWEAPLKSQQAYLIEKFGGNTGLGNICPDQTLALEALRNGLRFDTLDRGSSKMLRKGDWDP